MLATADALNVTHASEGAGRVDNKGALAIRAPSLADRYDLREGRVFLSGIQALVRLPMEQMRQDRAHGLRTRAFITGYPGSPLGGYDIALGQAGKSLAEHGVVHLPGQNEELAATTLMGTQMLDEHPNPELDGVVAYWYGKGPGIDRSGDALKHGNFAGTSTSGAVVILSGEDHEAKSSSVPYQQEFSFEHHGIPVLYPATVSEFVEFGLHAAEMSRYSGCWVALKLVGPLCDGGEVVEFRPDQFRFIRPELTIDGAPFKKVANFKFFPVTNIATERQLYVERHAAVKAYAQVNGLNRVTVSSDADRIGIVCAGKTYTDTLQALKDLGLDEAALRAAGIRLAKIGVLCPLDADFIRDFASGLKKLIVIEEKRDFLERQVGRAVCEIGPIQILGKFDADGRPLFPQEGGMNSDLVATLLERVLRSDIALPEHARCRVAELAALQSHDWGVQPRRTLNFCSGCPHNVSTKLAEGQVAWGAPGCHIFAAVMDTPDKRIEAVTQLGGEGLPWIGLAPFTARPHMVQNIGDGSLMHSSYQNIRFAVTAGVNITFKILFNGVIANTGGQVSRGAPSVVDLLRHLAIEGIAKIVLIAKEPQRYKGKALPDVVSLRTADRLEESMAELAEVRGTTVLIYDGECANERRRRQKRGKAPAPTRFTVVNEDVCENCGDCGRKANCMSLQKVETEFGAKTQIHQSSCNQDQACINGECPSFVTVEVSEGTKVRRPSLQQIDEASIPSPNTPRLSGPYNVYVPGLGGTGVITANAILAQAAALDGSEVKSYDQTGAAQKWGAVLSSLIISPLGQPALSNRVALGKADLYLALDLLAGVDRVNLACCNPGQTRAVMNSDVLPSGDMIRNPRIVLSKTDMIATIASATNGAQAIVVDARKVAEGLFGDYVMANMVTIGAAYQAGLLPISAANIETAIRLNGAQVDANILAFRAGRLSQHDAQALARLLHQPFSVLSDRVAEQDRQGGNATRQAQALVKSLDDLALPRALLERLEIRVADLIGYQDMNYARRYLEQVRSAAKAERALGGPSDELPLTRAFVQNLHKVMAYKDEYEVARLLVQRTFSDRVQGMFTGPVRMVYNLQPPFLRWFGLNRKVGIGPWAKPFLAALASAKRLRGTAFDPFGYLAVRREERELMTWYADLAAQTIGQLNPHNRHTALALISLPDDIRGYEHIKSKAISQAKSKALDLMEQLRSNKRVPKVIPLVVQAH